MIPKSDSLTLLFLLSCEQITNEFKFPIAAFHHAHETYLVPDTLKSAYGEPVVFSEPLFQQSMNAPDSQASPRPQLSSQLTVVTSARRIAVLSLRLGFSQKTASRSS